MQIRRAAWEKSTTAINLSSCLGAMGQKVLTIDLDPQGNTTSGLGVEKDAAENTVYELLLGECEVEECLQKLEFEGVSLIPSNVNLAGAEIELIGIEDKEYILQNKISKIRDQFDFIIIDCPPSLNMLTINDNDNCKIPFWYRFSVNITHWKDFLN